MNSIGHIAELRKHFEQVAVSEDVLPMETYMKNQFTFLGVKSTPRKVIQRDWFKTLPQTLSGDEVIALSASLFKEEEREFQYTAIDLLVMSNQSKTLFEYILSPIKNLRGFK